MADRLIFKSVGFAQGFPELWGVPPIFSALKVYVGFGKSWRCKTVAYLLYHRAEYGGTRTSGLEFVLMSSPLGRLSMEMVWHQWIGKVV